MFLEVKLPARKFLYLVEKEIHRSTLRTLGEFRHQILEEAIHIDMRQQQCGVVHSEIGNAMRLFLTELLNQLADALFEQRALANATRAGHRNHLRKPPDIGVE